MGDILCCRFRSAVTTLSGIQAEACEYGIPPIYADPLQVLPDFLTRSRIKAAGSSAAHYPARSRLAQPLSAGFFQPAPAQVPPDLVRHQQELMGPVAQFLTGLFHKPCLAEKSRSQLKLASGYAMARDQALGRLGLVWRRLKQFYADVMLLSVDCFRKNRPEDAEIPILGPGGEFESRWIRLADLKGNIQAHPESDETPAAETSQQRAVVQQLMASSDPMIQQALADPSNIGFVKGVLGLSDLVVPGEDSRNKQLREIDVLLAGATVAHASACGGSYDDDRGVKPLQGQFAASPLEAPHREPEPRNRKLISLSYLNPPCLLICCSTITPSSSRNAGGGRIRMRGKLRASNIPRASSTCAPMRRRICGRLELRQRIAGRRTARRASGGSKASEPGQPLDI